MQKYYFIILASFVLASCSSHKYSTMERNEKNSFVLDCNVPEVKISSVTDQNQVINQQSINQLNGRYTSNNSFDKLKRSSKLLVISKENYISDTIIIKRAPRGKAVAKDLLLGCLLFPIAPVPILIDFCRADFYKISNESKQIRVNLEFTQEFMDYKFEEIKNSNNPEVFQQYIVHFPKSSKINYAIDKRDSTELLQAIDLSTEEAIDEYIAQHEESRFLQEAKKIKNEMMEAKSEFELAKSQDDVEAYEQYLLKYPKSLQRNQAINLLVDAAMRQAIATKKSSELVNFNTNYLIGYRQYLNYDTIINKSLLLTNKLDQFLVRENTLPKVNNYIQYSNLWKQYIDLSLEFVNIGQLKQCEAQIHNISDFLLSEFAKINSKDQQIEFIAKANLDFRGLENVQINAKTGEKHLKSSISFINRVIDNSKKFNGIVKLHDQKYFENRISKLYMLDDQISPIGSYSYKDQSFNVFEQIKNTTYEEITLKAGTITDARLFDGTVLMATGKFRENQSEVSHYINGILVVTQYEGSGQGFYQYEFENGINISLRELADQIKKADSELANKNYDIAIEMYKKTARNSYPTTIPLNQQIIKSIQNAERLKKLNLANIDLADLKAEEAGQLSFTLVSSIVKENNEVNRTNSSNSTQSYSNKNVRDFADGRYYKNEATGKRIKYGYISSLNTYGITFDSDGSYSYFINCSEQLTSDEQYLELTFCMNTYNGGTLGKIGVYKEKIILSGTDENLVFYLDKGENSNSTKSVNELKSEVYKSNVSNLEIAQFDINELEGTTIEEAKLLCSNIGKGWRLPTKNELIIMYNHRDEINLEKTTTDLLYYVGLEDNKLIKLSMIDGEIISYMDFIGRHDKIRPVKR